MNRFAIARPTSFEHASELLIDKRFKLPIIKAGGMDVVDHLKEGLIEPDVLIDLKRLRVESDKPKISRIVNTTKMGDQTLLQFDATTTLAELIENPDVQKEAPVIVQALEHAATPQVRNVATAAGNLLQRPRCWYYRNDQFDCLKKGGPTCYAVEGENQYHAIFGDGPCHIVHPSNLAPALMICNAEIFMMGGDPHTLSIADLYHMPDKGVKSEHNLSPSQVMTSISLTAQPTSGFYAVKEKQSFDWPLALACAALELDGSTIQWARICAGAVAPVPWPLPNVEEALKGVDIGDDAALRKACALSIEGAKPMRDNAYKLKLLPVVVRRAILRAAGRPYET